MFARLERTPNDREQPLIQQWVEQLAPAGTGEAARDGWRAALCSIVPGGRRRRMEQLFARKRHERALAWMRSPTVRVTRVEASRVALLDAPGPVHVFDVGEDQLFALDLEWFPSDRGPWPNSVFEIWSPLKFPDGERVQLFCYGGELVIARHYPNEEVEPYGRLANSGFFVCEPKQGPFPGRFEDALEAYARYVDSPLRGVAHFGRTTE